jgi:starch phosphorylase
MPDQTYSIWLKSDIEGFDTLVDLALNLRWSWSHGEEELWEPLDPELWELTHNPWLVLQTVSRSKLKSLMTDATFRSKVDEAARAKQEQMQERPGFSRSTENRS